MPHRRNIFLKLATQWISGNRLFGKHAPAGIVFRTLEIGDTSGAAAVEFALITPVLLLVLVGTFVFGIALNNYIMVTNAAEAGTFQLTVSRGDSTPYTNTVNAIYSSAPGLTKAQLTVSLTVNGTACATDSACQTALTSASGKAASVQVSYPCSLTVMQKDYAPSCSLKANSTGRIQ